MKQLIRRIEKAFIARELYKLESQLDSEYALFDSLEVVSKLPKHIVRHSCDMISDEYVYKTHFRFQRMLKDGRWYVTYNNFIITHGQYRHDLEQWIDSNYA